MFKVKKGQMAITDLFIALFVATILVILLMVVWNRYSLILIESSDYEGMQVIAFQTADLLVKSSGEPDNWELNPDNVDTIGLASSDRVLSEEKVDAFLGLLLNITSNSLGLELYDFYFQLNHINGTMLKDYGESPILNESVINVQRLVLYKNEKAVVELALWK